MNTDVLIINGPNLGRLGKRDPERYGVFTLDDLQGELTRLASELGVSCRFYQSDREGGIVERIGQAVDESVAGIVINAGGYTHTSVAIRDALADSRLPFIEVHISNIFARESFRHHSYLSDIASGVICGLGMDSYLLGLRALARLLKDGG